MLKGNLVTLRPLKLSDWQHSVKWRNSMSNKQMAMMHPFPITEIVEKKWYDSILQSKNDRIVYFTITAQDDDPIGFVSLTNINYRNRNCYLSIIIGENKNHGKGYGKESLDLLINYAFRTLNLQKITLEVIAINEPAIQLYKKLGFVEEGRLNQQFYYEDNSFDVIILSLFRSTIEN